MSGNSTQASKPSIPKFTSFKPRPPQLTESDREENRSSVDQQKRHEPQRHHHHRSDRRYRHEHNRLSKSTEQRATDKISELYVIDKKGDTNNVIYGTLHRYSIPLFFRVGQGRVIGLSRDYRIERDHSEQQILYIRDSSALTDQGTNSFFSKRYKDVPARILRIRTDPSEDLQVNQDYIPLSDERARKRQRVNSSDDEIRNYRSVEGKVKASPTIDENLELLSETSESGSEARCDIDANKVKTIELSRAVEAKPSDVHAWLSLIDHQGSFTPRGGRALTDAEKRSVADLRISLYEKAIASVRDVQGKETLLLGLMKESSQIWESKKLASRWRSILRDYPNCTALWIKYLDFEQTNFRGFTYGRCRTIFLGCLKILRLSQIDEMEEIETYVLLRLTLMMHGAGYTELATAIWQANMELSFFRPESVSGDIQPLRAAFEEFWESEVARIGEENGRGWKLSTGEPVAPKTDVFTKYPRNDDLFGSWAECEEERSLHSQYPARALDNVEEDDLYRVILFSDVQEYLLFKPSPKLIVQAFLAFCRLPPLPGSDHKTWLDSFVQNQTLLSSPNELTDWFLRQAPETPINPLEYPMQCFLTTIDTLFAQPSRWFRSFKSGTTHSEWIRRILKALVDSYEDDDLAIFYLAFEYEIDPMGTKRLAKSLLKKRRSCISLYNAYALIEHRLGNAAAGDNVWASALSIVKDANESILLWKTWVWECLDEQRPSKALRLLLTAPLGLGEKFPTRINSDTLETNPTEFLRTRSFLMSSQQNAISARCFLQALYYTECLALLMYLYEDLDSSLKSYQSASDVVPCLQELHQSKARLLYYHVSTHKHYKPSVIHDQLEASIKLFPANTIFLSLYAWLGSRFRIHDRLRSIVRNPLVAEETVAGHLFSVYTELHRSISSGSTMHSCRAVFEHAVGTMSGKTSAGLWKLYLLFELRHGCEAKAREIFYRGMRACPWAKQFMMMAFTHMKLLMSYEELNKVYNVLGEKELRIHINLEGFEDEGPGRDRMEIKLPHDSSSEE